MELCNEVKDRVRAFFRSRLGVENEMDEGRGKLGESGIGE